MAVYVVRTRCSKGRRMPAGYQFRVITDGGRPTGSEIAEALEREGFPELVDMCYPQNWDIEKIS